MTTTINKLCLLLFLKQEILEDNLITVRKRESVGKNKAVASAFQYKQLQTTIIVHVWILI